MVREEASSFRDPAGQVVINNGNYLREVNEAYLPEYDRLMESGLYADLISNDLMIPHEELDSRLLLPKQVPFWSYPYEWCFSMLKGAAVTTLHCAVMALEYDMMMKDASAYNIQYIDGQMKLIDTLSFMLYQPGMMLPGYQQFVEHFLCPLLLMSYGRTEVTKLLTVNVDGISVDTAGKLLPLKARFNHSAMVNIYLPRLLQQHIDPTALEVHPTKEAVLKSINILLKAVDGLEYKVSSAWSKYENEDSYTLAAKESKKAIIGDILLALPYGAVADFGANTGEYSRFAHTLGHDVIALDRDHDCIERLYVPGLVNKLPLVIDICNPSPAIGWQNTERKSFLDRLHVDTIMALALIHHLCIGNNIPLSKVAELLAAHCRNLIIEFVPLDDKKAQILLGKKNIPPYSEDIFRQEFGRFFTVAQRREVADSKRVIYLMEEK